MINKNIYVDIGLLFFVFIYFFDLWYISLFFKWVIDDSNKLYFKVIDFLVLCVVIIKMERNDFDKIEKSSFLFFIGCSLFVCIVDSLIL